LLGSQNDILLHLLGQIDEIGPETAGADDQVLVFLGALLRSTHRFCRDDIALRMASTVLHVGTGYLACLAHGFIALDCSG